MKNKTIRISSIFPASTDEIWGKLQQVETLKYIAAPYAKFESQNKGELIWKEGDTLQYDLKLFGVFSLGMHTIHVVQFDKKSLVVFTNESNKFVPTWSHRIIVERETDTSSKYTDEIEINAGWETVFVLLWGILFYKHRQKKWKKLLNGH